jgi:hypothetical protein
MQFSLRKVQLDGQKLGPKKGSVNDVATILMRRVALEMSDSEDSDGGQESNNENEWD